MLEVESLSAAAGAFRLENVTLSVARGECHAVLGPSGSGKSTLLHALLGVAPALDGQIRLAGKDITRAPIERRGLGFVPQHIGLFPHLTVRDNLAYSARARRTPASEFQPRVDDLVAAAGIGALLDRRPDTLSGGERQRVGLVRALAGGAQVVLLDEPFGALNESLRRELWWMLRDLQRARQLAVLLVTHDLTEAYFLADRVTVLLGGRVVQQGEKSAVFLRPSIPEIARFLGVETLQPGRIIDRRDGLATVQVGAARLVAVAAADVPDDVLVSIRGEDVMLQGDTPAVMSARNALPARVIGLRSGSPLWGVELDAGFPLIALVTRMACEELGLREGTAVRAIIKAPVVHLIPRTGNY